MNLSKQVCKLEADKGQDVQRFNSFGQPFIVFSQASEARGPGKAAFNDQR